MEKKKRNIKLPQESSKSRQYKEWFQYAGLASEMLALLGLAVFTGYKIDSWLSWRLPIFLIVFPLVALGVFLWRLIKATGKNNG